MSPSEEERVAGLPPTPVDDLEALNQDSGSECCYLIECDSCLSHAFRVKISNVQTSKFRRVPLAPPLGTIAGWLYQWLKDAAEAD